MLTKEVPVWPFVRSQVCGRSTHFRDETSVFWVLARQNQSLYSNMSKTPIRVAVTGAAGAIGYSILFRIASGELFGPDQPVIIHLLIDIPEALPALQGVIMELEDCASPPCKNWSPRRI
jgi:hypothetical protein